MIYTSVIFRARLVPLGNDGLAPCVGSGFVPVRHPGLNTRPVRPSRCYDTSASLWWRALFVSRPVRVEKTTVGAQRFANISVRCAGPGRCWRPTRGWRDMRMNAVAVTHLGFASSVALTAQLSVPCLCVCCSPWFSLSLFPHTVAFECGAPRGLSAAGPRDCTAGRGSSLSCLLSCRVFRSTRKQPSIPPQPPPPPLHQPPLPPGVAPSLSMLPDEKKIPATDVPPADSVPRQAGVEQRRRALINANSKFNRLNSPPPITSPCKPDEHRVERHHPVARAWAGCTGTQGCSRVALRLLQGCPGLCRDSERLLSQKARIGGSLVHGCLQMHDGPINSAPRFQEGRLTPFWV